MPTGLELLAARYAKPKKPRRSADMFPEDSDPEEVNPFVPAVEPAVEPAETDLNNPSMLESTLRTVGLGGYGVRNAMMGNVEGIGRNAVDALTAIPRAILPGDQSRWELSREQDRPEFSNVIGGMEPGWAKLGVDIAGGILTDPLSFVGVGQFSAAAKAARAANEGVKAARATGIGVMEAAKAAEAANATLAASKAAGTTRNSLGFGLPFRAPVVEIPGSARAMQAIGTTVKAVTPPIVGDAAKAVGGFARRVAGHERIADWVKPILSRAGAITGSSAEAQTGGLRTVLEGVTEDEGRALFAAIENVTREGGLDKAGGAARQLFKETGEVAPYAATDNALANMGGAQSSVPIQSAEEAYLQVQKSTTRRNPLTGVDEEVGIRGLAGNADVKDVQQVMDALHADRAAARTLDQAYPPRPVDPRFASGVEITNNQLLRPGVDPLKGVKKLDAGDPLAKVAAEVVPPSASGVRAANDALAGATHYSQPGDVASMLGQVAPKNVSRSGAMMADVTKATNAAMGDVSAPLTKVLADDLPDLLNRWGTDEQHVAHIVQGLQAQGIAGPQLAKLTEAARKWVEFSRTQFHDAVKAGKYQVPVGRDLLRESPRYAMRNFTGPESEIDQMLGRAGGAASSDKGRTVKSASEYLNNNPDVKLESNLALIGAKRSAQQAQGLGKVSIAKALVERYAASAKDKLSKARLTVDDYDLLSESDRLTKAGLTEAEKLAHGAQWGPLVEIGKDGSDLNNAAKAIISEIEKSGDPETARVLMNVYQGMPPRGWLSKGLAKVNSIFKPSATAGAFIPRFNFAIRNVTTGAGGQILSNPEARSQFPKFAKQMAKMVWRSVDDGLEHLTGSRILRSENELAQYNQALRLGKGSIEQTAALIQNPRIREAYLSGVITDGFVLSEKLADEIPRTGWPKKWRDIRDWPAKIAQGSEQRARLTLFDGLRNDGHSVEEAARIVRETMFDYRISSLENRTAREVIPFFQFSAKAIPQASKLLVEKPAVASGLRALYSQDESTGRPLPSYMKDGINIPLGEGANGDPRYLSSLGLPIEVLSRIPNPSGNLADILGQSRRNILGAANPAIKTAVGALSGIDPYFGTPFGSYDKTPSALAALGAPERSEVSRLYNMAAGTGLIQPLSAPIAALSAIADPRNTVGSGALNALTGLRVTDVDEQAAMMQIIRDAISRDPSIRSSPNFYQLSKTPKGQKLLADLRAVQKTVRDKKKPKTIGPKKGKKKKKAKAGVVKKVNPYATAAYPRPAQT